MKNEARRIFAYAAISNISVAIAGMTGNSCWIYMAILAVVPEFIANYAEIQRGRHSSEEKGLRIILYFGVKALEMICIYKIMEKGLPMVLGLVISMLFALDDIKDFWGKVKGRIRSILKMPENIKHCNTNNTENTNTNAKWKRCRIFLLAVVANISAAKVAGTQGNIGWIVLMVLGAFPEYVVIIAKISERAWRDTELEFLQYIRVKDEPSSLMVYHTFGKIVELAFIAEISRKGLEPGLVLVVCVMFAIDNIKDFAGKVKDVTRFILKMPEYIVNRIKSVLEFADYQYADAKITDSEPADDQVAEAEPEDDQVAEAKPADDSELTNTEITADDQFADAVSEENNSAAPLKVYVDSRPKKSKNLLPLLPFAVAAIAIVCAVCVDKKLSRKRE